VIILEQVSIAFKQAVELAFSARVWQFILALSALVKEH